MTTATASQYRKLAQKAEDRLEWEIAAYFWMRAICSYPTVTGELSKKDIANMMERIEECKRMQS